MKHEPRRAPSLLWRVCKETARRTGVNLSLQTWARNSLSAKPPRRGRAGGRAVPAGPGRSRASARGAVQPDTPPACLPLGNRSFSVKAF